MRKDCVWGKIELPKTALPIQIIETGTQLDVFNNFFYNPATGRVFSFIPVAENGDKPVKEKINAFSSLSLGLTIWLKVKDTHIALLLVELCKWCDLRSAQKILVLTSILTFGYLPYSCL